MPTALFDWEVVITFDTLNKEAVTIVLFSILAYYESKMDSIERKKERKKR